MFLARLINEEVILLKRQLYWKWALILSLVLNMGVAFTTYSKEKLGEILPGEYALKVVNNHRPVAFKNSKAYWKSLQHVELKLGGQEAFLELPDLKQKKPYVGKIILGDQKQEFGVIVDVNGFEKRLYIDQNGDGSFAGETWHPLLNQWQGLQIYWVEEPEPIKLMVNYQFDQSNPRCIEIITGGIINKPGPLYNEKPYLKVEVRTWFLGKIRVDGFPKLVAVVDRNNNGSYNDKVDQLFIDFNDNGYFEEREVIRRKKGFIIKSRHGRQRVDWTVYPDKLIIGGKPR